MTDMQFCKAQMRAVKGKNRKIRLADARDLKGEINRKSPLRVPFPRRHGRRHQSAIEESASATITLLPFANLLFVADIADIKTLDQAVLYLEHVDHHFVGKEIAFWVTHHLMDFDDGFPLSVG